MIFHNDNGYDYRILAKNADIALLVQLNADKFVVAIDIKETSWGAGGYYDNIHDAYESYIKKTGTKTGK